MFKDEQAADSLDRIKALTNKIIVSITRDTLEYAKLNIFLKEEFSRKSIAIDYAIIHYKEDSITGGYNKEALEDFPISIFPALLSS